jgi:hypothetical protein
VKCAIELVSIKKQRAEDKSRRLRRAQTRKARVALKTLKEWLDEAQNACNAYIRERDRLEPCISCGTTNQNIQYCAGHYKSRGARPELRFNPMNIHKQCNFHCNQQKSGNIENYRPNLVSKIGLRNVEWLEGHHKPQNLTIEDAQEIKQYYKDQLKVLKNDN